MSSISKSIILYLDLRPAVTENQDGIVGVTGWTRGVSLSDKAKDFSLLQSVLIGPGIHPALRFGGKLGAFPGLKRPGSGVNHHPPSSADVSYNSTFLLGLHGFGRNKFIFLSSSSTDCSNTRIFQLSDMDAIVAGI
jgi:hypothetical protein